MSWSKYIATAVFVSLSGCATPTAVSAEICPSSPDRRLRFVDLYDGTPEELATLVPDKARAHSGYWQLGYVYDAGRFVTIRCKYADGKAVDVKIPQRVGRCDYRIDAQKTLALHCK